ncbi:hypothetical protein [Actinoplanes regularis]|uniref:hypothetical protein n=1 Tax=Actinoplanes regularis TaxID=52697 RepID=UPI0024A51361|nr:hypothetical protein [Actinoplanes regularis]GLW29910.1 hypothetical protein Areg01_28500 [Actinoplanes regularis]
MTGAEFHGVDIDLLADYVGGALDGTPEAARVASLIAAEPGWREAYELLAPEMATVGALLGELPAEPMPDDVVARLEAALAVEPAPRVTGVPVEAVPESVDAGHSAAPAVPPKVVDLDERRRKRGNRRWIHFAAPIGVAAGAAAFVGYGLLAQPQFAADQADSRAAGDSGAGEAMVAAAPQTTLTSGINYTLGTLGRASKSATGIPMDAYGNSEPPTVMTSSTELDRLTDHNALLDCLNAIAAENGGGALTVRSVDYARFDGDPALVVRFTASNGEWAWASGPGCGLPGGGADTRGAVPVR